MTSREGFVIIGVTIALKEIRTIDEIKAGVQ